MAERQSQNELPLSDVLIADFSRVLSGPLATMLLADMGAEVVKVERPGSGDDTRSWGPPFIGLDTTYFLAVNRNKRSVVLDLRDPEDNRLARTLALQADVLVENFRPGTMERLNLGYEILAEENPGLVYASISAFGRTVGASLPGYDFLIQALGGLMSITGEADGPPVKAGVAVVDVLAGLFATIGILAALRERERSGRGQRVDLTLLSSLLTALVNQSQTFASTETAPARMGNEHPSVAPYELYETADVPIVLAVGTDRQFGHLARILDLEERAVEKLYSCNADRIENRKQMRMDIASRLTAMPAVDWLASFREAGIPAGTVNDIGGAMELASELELQPTLEIPSGDGRVAQVSNPLHFSRTPVEYRLPPPTLGQHGDEIREWLRSKLK